MSELPTVMIRKANKWGYAIINEADFNSAKHKLFSVEDEALPPAAGEPTEIPAEWRGLHWKQQVALAKQLTGQEAGNAAAAVALIQGHIAAQAAAEANAEEA